MKLKDGRKEVERREIVLKYSVVKGFLAAVSLAVWGLGDEAESSLCRGLVAGTAVIFM